MVGKLIKGILAFFCLLLIIGLFAPKRDVPYSPPQSVGQPEKAEFDKTRRAGKTNNVAIKTDPVEQTKPRDPTADFDVKKRYIECKKFYESVRMHFRELQEARRNGISLRELVSLRRRINELQQRIDRAFAYAKRKPDFQPEWWISLAAGELQQAALDDISSLKIVSKLDDFVMDDLKRAAVELRKLEEQKKKAYPFD